jgi:hypothetical protein
MSILTTKVDLIFVDDTQLITLLTEVAKCELIVYYTVFAVYTKHLGLWFIAGVFALFFITVLGLNSVTHHKASTTSS